MTTSRWRPATRDDCIQLLDPQHKKDTALLEQAQRRPQRWWEDCSTSSMEDRLREVRFFSLKQRRLHRNFTAAFPYLKGAFKKEGELLFTQADNYRTRRNSLKWKQQRFRLHVRKKFFIQRVLRHWNTFSREVVDSPFLEVFEVRLDVTLSNLI